MSSEQAGPPLPPDASTTGSGRPGWGAGTRLGAALVAVGLLVFAAVGVRAVLRDDDGAAPGTTELEGPPADEASPTGRDLLPGFGFGEVALVVIDPDGTRRVLCVMEAAEAVERARGLMEVTDETLGGYDGMIFLFPVDSEGGFWMRNTPMPLSIAYLSADGGIVSTADMAPCEDSSDCPSYPAAGPYRSALEVPQGRLDDLGVVPGARIEVGGGCEAPSS